MPSELYLIEYPVGQKPPVPAPNEWAPFLQPNGLYLEDDQGNVSGPFIPEAPVNGVQYARKDGAWELISSTGLTNVATTPTTTDVVLQVNKRHFVDASGLTADRALKLPTGSDGDQIEVRMVGEHASYACKLQGDTAIALEGLTATEWDRLYHTGMALRFVYRNGDGWRVVSDNRGGLWRRILLTNAGPSIDFANIPNIYNTLRFKVSARSALAATTFDTLVVNVNGLSTGIYDWTLFYWYNNSGTPTWGTTQGSADTKANLTSVPAATAPANSFGGGFLDIEDYANTNKYKRLHWRGGMHITHTVSGARIYDNMGEVLTTAAINRVAFSLPSGTNFLAQSEITLYCSK